MEPEISIPVTHKFCSEEQESEVVIVCRFLKTYMQDGESNSMDQNRLHGAKDLYCLLFRDDPTGGCPGLQVDETIKASVLKRIETEKEDSECSAYLYLPILRCQQCLDYFGLQAEDGKVMCSHET